jgi:hypothetical protein
MVKHLAQQWGIFRLLGLRLCEEQSECSEVQSISGAAPAREERPCVVWRRGWKLMTQRGDRIWCFLKLIDLLTSRPVYV